MYHSIIDPLTSLEGCFQARCLCPTHGPPRCDQVARGMPQRGIMMHIIDKGVMQRVLLDLTKFRHKKASP
jgi:hypothetical protein